MALLDYAFAILYYTFWCIGVLVFMCHSTRPLATLFRYFKKPLPQFKELYGRKNEPSWVVLIGLDDLTLEYGRLLADQGFQLLICKDLSSPHRFSSAKFHEIKVEGSIEEITFDSAECTKPECFKHLQVALEDKNLALIVCNIDYMSDSNEASSNLNSVQKTVELNCTTFGLIMRTILPYVRENKARCGILNVTSMMGVEGFPTYATYCGAQAYQNFMTIGLWKFVQEKADCLSYQPYIVRKNTFENVESFFAISPREAAASSLRDLGSRRWTLGHWKHGLASWLINTLPDSFRNSFLKRQVSHFKQHSKKVA